MEFVTYESACDFNNKTQAVRSYVTRRQHRLRREAEQRALNKNEGPGIDGAQFTIEEQSLSIPDPNAKSDGQVASQQTKTLSRKRRSTKKRAVSYLSNPPRLPPQVSLPAILPCQSTFNSLESFFHVAMVPSHVLALGLDTSESQVASRWFASASASEPALYTAALLSVAPTFKHASEDLLLYLQRETISTIIKALANEERRRNPALLMAVESLAFYEFLYGDREVAQRVHRPAMRKLIQLHGGRDHVQMPFSWKKVSLLADLVMEIKMGSEGESSFLEHEQHQNAGILETEWTEALMLYLPDVEGKADVVKSQS